MAHACYAVLRYISHAKFLLILEVLRDFHRLFKSRNSRTTGILHTIRHVYKSVWPAREAKPRFGAALERSAQDCETRLQSSKVWRHHFANFFIRTLKHHQAINAAAVGTGAKFHKSTHESEDREFWSFKQSHTNLSYLASVPNCRNKH